PYAICTLRPSIKKFGFIRIPDLIKLADLLQDRPPKLIDIPALRCRNKDTVPIRLTLPAFTQLAEQLRLHPLFQPRIEDTPFVEIDLIKDHQHRFIKGVKLLQGLVDDPQLLFIPRVRDIHNVQKNIRLPYLIKRALKAFDKMMRQLADK